MHIHIPASNHSSTLVSNPYFFFLQKWEAYHSNTVNLTRFPHFIFYLRKYAFSLVRLFYSIVVTVNFTLNKEKMQLLHC